MSKDYSEYQYTPYEKKLIQQRDTDAITFKVFRNTAAFDPSRKTIHIIVDDGFEEVTQLENLKEYDRIDQLHHERHPDVETPEEEALSEEQRLDGLAQNRQDFAKLCSKFKIDRTIFDGFQKSVYFDAPDMKETPLYNVLSGAEISLHYGEGLLDFVYADFEPGFHQAMTFSSWLFLVLEGSSEDLDVDASAAKNTSRVRAKEQPKVYSKVQEIVDEYFDFSSSAIYIAPIIYRSLYTAICPPAFKHDSLAREALNRYYDYVLFLQKEYRELIEFCFDPNFYPEVLGQLHAVERYSLHQRIHNLPADIIRSERFDFDVHRMSGDKMPYGIQSEDFVEQYSEPKVLTDAHKEFAAKFNVSEKELKMFLTVPGYLNVRYGFRSIAELLQLEFSKMLEANMKLEKNSETGCYSLPIESYAQP